MLTLSPLPTACVIAGPRDTRGYGFHIFILFLLVGGILKSIEHANSDKVVSTGIPGVFVADDDHSCLYFIIIADQRLHRIRSTSTGCCTCLDYIQDGHHEYFGKE